MNTLTRRRFLVASGMAAAATAAAGTLSWSDLHHHAKTHPLPQGAKVLVLVTMYGGNDGLNTLIPYADPAYHDARPELAYAEPDVLHLDGSLGLNPAMTGMRDLWQAKRLAIVRGVGYPKPDHSHFRSMDIWQTASPSEPVNTGWIGRWLDATGDDPVRAVSIGSVLPPLAIGAHSTAAALPTVVNRPFAGFTAASLTDLGVRESSDTSAEAMVRSGYRAERAVAATFGTVLAAPAVVAPAAVNPLALQLDMVGRCIKAGVPTSVYAVSLGGFDTHADERGTQQALLGQLDSAVSGFLTDMAGDPRGRGVVLMTYSEFGRRMKANASQGTDHGTAAPVFVAGVPVAGGFYGDEPSLTNLDDGDLKASTDFRVVYGEMLAEVLKTDPTRVLGVERPSLGLIAG